MITNVNGINELVYTNRKTYAKIENSRASTIKSDNYMSSSEKNIPIETIDFKTGNTDSQTVKFIESEFRTKYGSWDDNKISLYDINACRDLFPLELGSGKVLAFGNNFGDANEQSREICYDLTVKTHSGPVRLEVQLGNHFKDTPMDEHIFKNTVIKGFIILAESLKMDEEIGNSSLAGGSDVQISRNYDSEFRQKYVGRLNLAADSETVKKVKSKYQSIFESILRIQIE